MALEPSGTRGRAVRALAPILGAACGLAGCALATDTPPTATVTSVRLTAIGLTAQRLATELCVTNPNRNALAFRRVAVTLDVAGAPLAAGTSDLPLTLPPLSSTTVPFTVVTTVRNIVPQLLGVIAAGELDYRVHGTVTLAGGWPFPLPFSRSGHLDPLAGGLQLASAAADPAPAGACDAPR